MFFHPRSLLRLGHSSLCLWRFTSLAVPLIVVSDVLKEFREEFKIKSRREGALWLP